MFMVLQQIIVLDKGLGRGVFIGAILTVCQQLGYIDLIQQYKIQLIFKVLSTELFCNKLDAN